MTRRAEGFAFYLPQFYPMELNSLWWGEGFTEWNSVIRAHRGWRSPESVLLTPGELGFYDLRSRDVRRRQGELARAAGLSALCVYHYWSAGHRLLPEVEDALLDDGEPDVPFFLGWANHDWTLAWKGRPQEVVFAQDYDEHLTDDHIERLLESFDDPRYYRVAGRPVLFVYYPLAVPHHVRVFERWREVAQRRGHEILLLGGAPFHEDLVPPREAGLDAWVQGTSGVFGRATGRDVLRVADRSVGGALSKWQHRDAYWPYEQLAATFQEAHSHLPDPAVPLVISSWNNVGRRLRRASFTDSTPAAYEKALRTACEQAPTVAGTPLVAINAWNEWGEGMTLEPSLEHGRAMIEATARALGATSADQPG